MDYSQLTNAELVIELAGTLFIFAFPFILAWAIVKSLESKDKNHKN